LRITFYGGLGEIGGNKVMIECEGSRLLIDFGRNFRLEDSFFQHPYDPPLDVGDLVRTGIVPDIPELYANGEAVEAVVISHAHTDHYGHIPLLAPGTRVLMGETAKMIIDARLESMARPGWMERIDHLQIETFRTGDEFDLGPFRVRPVHVDHSVPGAYGLLIECGGVSIAYSGDLRLHGEAGKLTLDFVREASEWSPWVLMLEGTRVAPESDPEAAAVRLFEQVLAFRLRDRTPKRVAMEADTEAGVLETLKGVLDDHAENLVMVESAWADVDRMRTVWRAASAAGRRLLMDEKAAYLLDKMRRDPKLRGLPPISEISVMVWRRRKIGHPASKALSQALHRVEDEGGEVLSAQDAAREVWASPGSYLFLTSQPTRALKDLMAGGDGRGKLTYVMSRSEPFTEEMVIGLDRLLNWLALYGVRSYYRIHVSGHASPQDLGRIADDIGPELILPIHTEHPDLFGTYLPRDLRRRLIMAKLAEPLSVP